MSIRRIVVKINFLILKLLRTRGGISILLLWLLLSFLLIFSIVLHINNDPFKVDKPFIFIEPITSYYRFHHSNFKRDWHDYELIKREALRTGPGEQGRGVYIPLEEQELASKIYVENKHNGLASDKIARDRSLPDTRPSACRNRTYLNELPSVSVIIPFHNEVLSTLTRTIHSVFNRSPPELLTEVILVNDHSDKEHCYGELEEYIKEFFDPSKIRLLVMDRRYGLMWARLAGARAAIGDVLVFMDCHTEANVNWLPPLIEPIALNYRTCVCPYIDVISARDYSYMGIGQGSRGVFNWQFYYQFLPLRPGDQDDETEPFQSPVMMGCVFAISAKFFWELGGYDPGLSVWGGEQYELSFKTWLCHGQQLDAPCSRVGHLYRPRPFLENLNDTNYCHRNYKRVAEVWMDEYAHHVYDKDPEEWYPLEIGDVSYMKSIKKKLNCKPFKYFLEVVAPDMLDKFPPFEPVVFASGAIQSLAYPKYCIDTLGSSEGEPIGLYSCKSENLTEFEFRQYFILRQHRDILVENSNNECFDANYEKVSIFHCKFTQDNQYFRYDVDTQQIIVGPKRKNKCMDLSESKTIIIAACDAEKITQKFH
ncbi:hypothetical protein PVAND_015217 [Polypedilum vanderplanki]|uniref:Polypeptide N-acetylgalactosaminyltransferase n=1 Tax=Polypedilum vanderplanki TaxID=319348 RepID=A0A9J6BC01_POLVA|nr:hypothetical protein PVAND_015217 [Polypedilum vanderplanki]